MFETPPYTEATIIILPIIDIFLFAIPVFLIIATLLVAFFKSGQLKKPLGILHVSLLIEIFLNKLSVAIVLSAYYPSALRHCDCSPILSTIYLSSRSLTLSFRSMVYASISLCQLLIITNKRKYVTRKTVCGCVAFAIGAGAIFATETAVLTRLSDERLVYMLRLLSRLKQWNFFPLLSENHYHDIFLCILLATCIYDAFNKYHLVLYCL